MALAMSRPYKHPKTGIYWLRKRVPDELRALVGKREELRSLKTRDPDEAKRLFATALAEVEAKWASLRRGPAILTEREAHELASVVYGSWLRRHRDNPSQQTFWKTDIGGKLWLSLATNKDGTVGVPSLDEQVKAMLVEMWCTEESKALLKDRGLKVDEASELRLAKAIGAVIRRASLALADLARGHVSNDRPSAAHASALGSNLQAPPSLPGKRSTLVCWSTAGRRKSNPLRRRSTSGGGSPNGSSPFSGMMNPAV